MVFEAKTSWHMARQAGGASPFWVTRDIYSIVMFRKMRSQDGFFGGDVVVAGARLEILEDVNGLVLGGNWESAQDGLLGEDVVAHGVGLELLEEVALQVLLQRLWFKKCEEKFTFLSLQTIWFVGWTRQKRNFWQKSLFWVLLQVLRTAQLKCRCIFRVSCHECRRQARSDCMPCSEM